MGPTPLRLNHPRKAQTSLRSSRCMSSHFSLLLRWLAAAALATLSYLLNEQASETEQWSNPWFFPTLFAAVVAQAAFALAWLPKERLPWSRMPVRVAVLLVAGLVETVVLLLAMLLWVALAWAGWLVGSFVGGLLFLWVVARLLPLGPVALLSDHGPVASVGAAWDRSRGTALVGVLGVALAMALVVVVGLAGQAPAGRQEAPLPEVLALLLLGGLSAWAYRTGPVLPADGAHLEPDGDARIGIDGITPSLPEVEWERPPS